ncbi:hypothetical protein Cni_G19604 [Canna indica]|uniref:DUF4283 domain-containing protein n=1 Tax=Canna indica TaxID=4628 RepID=A0AAQ3QJX0_9LILI|nr:hypothetical protein Cni_G19604 [Canna indica]
MVISTPPTQVLAAAHASLARMAQNSKAVGYMFNKEDPSVFDDPQWKVISACKSDVLEKGDDQSLGGNRLDFGTKLRDMNEIQVPIGTPKPWSPLFASFVVQADCLFMFEKPNFQNGEFVVDVFDEELDAGADQWRYALMGHFIRAKLFFPTIKEQTLMLWRPGELQAFSLPSGFLIFRFCQEEDMLYALEGEPWFIQGKKLLLKRWPPGMKLEKESLSSIPLWVKIHELLLEFWSASIIGKVMS